MSTSDIDKVAEELRRRGVPSQDKPAGGTENTLSPSKKYTQAVSQWLDLYRAHYTAHSTMMVAPYYMAMGYAQAACQFMANQQTGASPSGGAAGSGSSMAAGAQPNQAGARGHVQQNVGPVLAGEFVLPSLYRRIFAEFIDFVLLFTIKFTVTMYAMIYFGIVDQTTFALKFLAEEIDEDATMEDLQQVLSIAVVYRLFVCIYETIFLASTMRRAGIGGATPGKYMMGLRAISCERVNTIDQTRVQVTLPDNLTYTQSLGRAVIKNFSMAFFFPACLTIFFNPHMRATYDIITRTIVVSANQDFQRDLNNNNRNPGR